MISKTQISKRLKNKRNPELRETIKLAKAKNHLELAKKLCSPIRLHKSLNVGELNEINEKEIIVIGRILGEGNIDKKIKISALGFSKQAVAKLKKAGCEIKTIKKELQDNANLKGVKII